VSGVGGGQISVRVASRFIDYGAASKLDSAYTHSSLRVKIDQCHRSAEQTAGVRSARIANIPAAHQPQSREQVREQPVRVYRKAAFSGATVPKWSAITSNRGGGFQSSPLHTYYMEDTIAPGSLSVICHPAEVVLTPP